MPAIKRFTNFFPSDFQGFLSVWLAADSVRMRFAIATDVT
jgi:hypothetical protein